MMVVLNFFAAGAFVYLSLRSLATRRNWHDDLKNTYQIPLAKKEQSNAELLKGKIENNKVERGIKQLSDEIDRTTINRGRVWRTLETSGKNGTKISVDWKGEDPHGIADKSIVCLFGDVDVAAGGEYIGEFKVTKADAKKIDLELTYLPSQADLNRIANVRKVNVYESMPLDDRSVFSETLDDPKLRDALLSKLTPEVQNEFKKDGQPATAEDLADKNLADRIYVQVKFIEEYTPPKSASELPVTRKVKVPNDDAGNPDAAQVKMEEVQVKFEKEQIAWLPKVGQGNIPGADDLIADKKALAVADSKPIYRRPMREYAPMLEDLRRQYTLVLSDATQLGEEIKALQRSVQETDAAFLAEKTEAEKLTKDLPQFKTEQVALGKFLEQLQTQHAAKVAELRAKFKENREMAEQITVLHAQALDAANRAATVPEADSPKPDPSKSGSQPTVQDRDLTANAVSKAK